MTTTHAARRLGTDGQQDQALTGADKTNLKGPVLYSTPNWRQARLGKRIDLYAFEPPDSAPGAWCNLPAAVADRVAEASEIIGWVMDKAARLVHGYGRYRKVCLSALAWAHWLGWSEQNLMALATFLLEHRLPNPAARVDPLDARKLVLTGRWLVNGGPAPWTTSHVPPSERRYRPPSVPKLSADDARRSLTWIEEQATAFSWPGRAGATDRKVFLAIVRYAIGLKFPRIDLYIGARQLSDLAGPGKDTIVACLKRLEAAGFLSVVSRGRGVSASTYRIQWPQPISPYTVSEAERTLCPSSWLDQMAGHPAWADLGQPCLRMLSVLRTAIDGLTDLEWRREAGVERRPYVEKYLPRLANGIEIEGLDAGIPLVEFIDGRWRVLADLETRLDKIAELTGAAQRRRRRTESHRLERAKRLKRFAEIHQIDERYRVLNERRSIDTLTGGYVLTTDTYDTALLPPCVACGVGTAEHVGGMPFHDTCPIVDRIRVEEVDTIELPGSTTFGPVVEHGFELEAVA